MKSKITVTMVMMVTTVCILFSSCTKTEKMLKVRDSECFPDGVVVLLNENHRFILADKPNLSAKKQQFEKQTVVSSLNRAIQDRPELAGMLEANIIDSGSNDYIYEGGESFLRVVGEFVDDNYSKAISMFPEITCESFYYHCAIAYAISNHDPELFEIPYIEFLNIKNTHIKKYNPKFDHLMSFAFWTSYCSERFELSYDNDNYSFDDIFRCENLDCEITFELAMMLEISLFESIINGNVSADSNQKRSTYITEFMNDMLLGNGVIEVSSDTTDFFSQIGNSVFLTSLVVYIFTHNNNPIMLGHFGAASSLYLGWLMPKNSGGNAHINYASLICASLAGEQGSLTDIVSSDWNVNVWAHGNKLDYRALDIIYPY